MREGNASRVTDTGGAKIGDGRGAESGVGGESVQKEIVQESGEKRGGAELVSQMKRQRSLQGRVREDGRVEVAG